MPCEQLELIAVQTEHFQQIVRLPVDVPVRCDMLNVAPVARVIFADQVAVSGFHQVFHIRVTAVQMQVLQQQITFVELMAAVFHAGLPDRFHVQPFIGIVEVVAVAALAEYRLAEFLANRPRRPVILAPAHRAVLCEYIALPLDQLAV